MPDQEEKYKQSESPPDLEVSPEVEHKVTVWAALACIEDGDLSPKEAMDLYHITADDLAQYKPEWDAMEQEDTDADPK